MAVSHRRGITMQRISGLIVAAVLVSTVNGGPTGGALMISGGSDLDFSDQRGALDIPTLLTAARGAPPVICALAAQAVRGFGWGGNWSDAPSTPLASFASYRQESDDSRLSPSDTELLLAALASDDACVRELAVRVLGQYKNEAVVNGLITRLTAPSSSLREVAALGLGMMATSRAVDPLIRALRDSDPGVRANAAWALGHTENGRALSPLLALFRDDADKVREAAVIATGRLDSSSAVSSLIRVVRQDQSPSVR